MIEMNQEEEEIDHLHPKENINVMINQVNIMIIDRINLEIIKMTIIPEIKKTIVRHKIIRKNKIKA